MIGLQRYALSDRVDRVVSGPSGQLTCCFHGNTLSGRPFEFLLPLEAVNRWMNGESIQNAFPYLTAEEREIMLTGMDDECWANTFGEDE